MKLTLLYNKYSTADPIIEHAQVFKINDDSIVTENNQKIYILKKIMFKIITNNCRYIFSTLIKLFSLFTFCLSKTVEKSIKNH